jgi:2-oxoisovalerate dehydrogenase E1 component
LAQILLGSLLTHSHDAIAAYYRSRPILLAAGLSVEDAFASPLARAGGYNDGRDIGVVVNLPSTGGATVLPMTGEVGGQYTPIAGWAQAMIYRQNVLKEDACRQAIGCTLGGEGSVATNGFWSALTMAATLKLPVLFFIEDNGYAISVRSDKQTPGGDIVANLASFSGLRGLSVDGTDPEKAGGAIFDAVNYVRSGKGPMLLRARVPRLNGHSGQDTQAYRPADELQREKDLDPLGKLKTFMIGRILSEEQWNALAASTEKEVEEAAARALARPEPDPAGVRRFVFRETAADGTPVHATAGGARGAGFPPAAEAAEPEEARSNMITVIRRTLQAELRANKRVLLFGEDIGPKGGVHAVTMGLQEEFGEARVFDTSLSEEGIIGRAVGMGYAGLVPVAEIQFRKYADPATEQLNNCGTIRWRTANRFASPIVVRIPVGFAKVGDPWHSVSREVEWAHGIGWQVLFPSNAEDAAGLLRAAIRSDNPSIFLEHRAQYDSPWARRPYPGDRFILPIGKGRKIRSGDRLTVVSWGAFVERCDQAAERAGGEIDLLDLRTISPWDREMVLESVKRTRRCLVVHEDTITAGFGAEIAAVVAEEAFLSLDAPVTRIAPPDIPVPYNVRLMAAFLPDVDEIAAKMTALKEF